MARSSKDMRKARLDKMRMGQGVASIVALATDQDERVALVPLTQGEYITSLQIAATLPVDDNIAGRISRDEVQRAEILAVSCREVSDLTERYFENSEAVRELEAADINLLFDEYLQMVNEQSPALIGLSEEDFNDLKKGLQTIPWSELSGPEWYAAQRFLDSIRHRLLMVNLPGSQSTSPLTPTIEEN